MGMIYILIPLSLALVGVAVWAFLWAVNSGQFDDLDTPGWDILSDDAPLAATAITEYTTEYTTGHTAPATPASSSRG